LPSPASAYDRQSRIRQRVKNPQEVIDFFQKYRGRVLLYGITSAKEEYPLQFNLN